MAQIKVSWIWDNTRSRLEKVSWHRLLWFPGHIPKFSLISWMTILDKLPTKDKLARFGLTVEDKLPTKDRLARFGLTADNGCVLCNFGLESRNHLFSKCVYAKGILCDVLHSCGLTQEPLCWSDNLQWMLQNLKGKSLIVHILKLAGTGLVYYTWEERNLRLFRGLAPSIKTIGIYVV
ncbi:uncharacterized protein LOC120180030 [Hibiscus syriacus]|uniref:uncharacterized protein LOC120180030 n=1 Tax=Hibiscus syriacus TaxID=106335 RepID=UPI00192089EC|nr:uncharacterized protein LOC120180030 [Hibiscus syriacus]